MVPNVNQASHTPSVWGYYSTEHNKESVIQGLTFSHYSIELCDIIIIIVEGYPNPHPQPGSRLVLTIWLIAAPFGCGKFKQEHI